VSEVTAKADRVERLLNDRDFKQALEDTRNAILQRFSETPPSQTEQLVECRKLLHLLDSVEANLKQAIRDGKLEVFTHEQQKTGFLQELRWKKRA
jgi:hypothetical protein